MATVAQMPPTEQVVWYTASQACARYTAQDDCARIAKAVAMILDGGVTLNADGSADIHSQRGSGSYHVTERCSCMDFARGHERCKHRYAKAIWHRAQHTLAQAYYATYSDWRGVDSQGIAFPSADGADWVFLPEHSRDVWRADQDEVVLGGNVAIANQKHAEEEAAGGLAALVCGYGHAPCGR